MIDFDRLTAHFPPEAIEWRPGSMRKDGSAAMALAYIDARAVMGRLDDVCGPENWQVSYSSGPAGGVLCRLSLRCGDEWIAKEDAAENTDIEPIKGGVSKALVRAAVPWGIGRYLYDLPSQWVDLDEYKRFKRAPMLPGWALPAGSTNPVPPPAHERPAVAVPALSAELRTPAAEQSPSTPPRPQPKPAAHSEPPFGSEDGETAQDVNGDPSEAEWFALIRLMPEYHVIRPELAPLLAGRFSRDTFLGWLKGHPGRSARVLLDAAIAQRQEGGNS